MSTPTPTPGPWIAEGYDLRQKHGRMIAYFGPHHTPADEYPMSCRLEDEANAQWVAAARNELAAAKAECERLMNQRDNLLKPLRARAEDRADAADEKVERLTSENEKLTIERDALANGSAIEIARLRADNLTAHQMACAAGWERDQLRAELKELSQAYELNRVSIDELDADRARAEKAEAERDALRAEVERLKGALALGQENCDFIYNNMREERTELTARAAHAEAMLAEWSVLNLWGGTPEIIHEFIKGQQNRIHHCQDLETELAHLRAAIDAAMKS